MDWIEQENHVGELVQNGLDAKDRLRFYNFDLVILDWQLPGLSGLEVLRNYRAVGGNALVLLLTGKSQIEDKESGFEVGADDYLTKPFHIRELTARVGALLSRPRPSASNDSDDYDVRVDKNRCLLIVRQREIKLLPKELALITLLLSARGEFVSIEKILASVWDDGSNPSLDALRTLVKRIRTKLETVDRATLESQRGTGYRLVVK